MKKWWQGLSVQEKCMLALAVLLVVGIIIRWGWVSSGVVEAFKNQFSLGK